MNHLSLFRPGVRESLDLKHLGLRQNGTDLLPENRDRIALFAAQAVQGLDLRDPPGLVQDSLRTLEDILIFVLCAVICGAETWVDIADFAKAKEAWLRTFLGLPERCWTTRQIDWLRERHNGPGLKSIAVVEVQSDQRQMEVIDGPPRQPLDVPAQFVVEVPDPSTAEHAGRWEVYPTGIGESVSGQDALESRECIRLCRCEFEDIHWLRGPVAESVRIPFGSIAAENGRRRQCGKRLAQRLNGQVSVIQGQ